MNRKTIWLTAILATAMAIQAFGQDVQIVPWKPLTKLVPVQTQTGFDRNVDLSRIWRVSPDADHHKAVVRVCCPDGYAGSGVVVATDKEQGLFVLTNRHVIETCLGSTLSVIGSKGSTRGSCIYHNQTMDVAVIYCSQGVCERPATIAAKTPAVGTDVELCGYGGPNPNSMRHFYGRRIQTRYALSIDAACISGDSGGPMFDSSGDLCGINWGAPGNQSGQRFGGWMLVRPATSNADAEWLATTLTQICRPYGCRPIIRGRGTIVTPTPVPVPAQGSPGTPGPIGPQGEPGPAGPPGADATVTPEQLGAIAAAITEQLRNDPALRGEPGPPGMVNPADLQAAVEEYFRSNPNTISLALVDESGRVIDRDTVELGGTLRLQFVERKPDAAAR